LTARLFPLNGITVERRINKKGVVAMKNLMKSFSKSKKTCEFSIYTALIKFRKELLKDIDTARKLMLS